MRRVLLAAVVLSGCRTEPISVEGRLGAPVALATGDASPLPRLAFIDEGCPGAAAAGGCPASGDRQCSSLLIDSLAPITAIRDPSVEVGSSSIDQECLEVRAAAGLAAMSPTEEALAAAVTRFRFFELPLVRAPDTSPDWTWTVGDELQQVEPGGVLGGNLLNEFAVSLRTPSDGAARLRLFGEFPGTEEVLADQGRAFLRLQFPGSLLGRDLEDRCRIDGDNCELAGYDLRPGQSNIALESTRMVLDACVAPPPCTVKYDRGTASPFGPGKCSNVRGLGSTDQCIDADASILGGKSASLIMATSVHGLVLFDDSATRMFGDLDALPSCDAVTDDTAACFLADDGQLFFAGWPDAGLDVPLRRLAVRSLALVSGATQPRDVGPCERVDRRRQGLLAQCQRWRALANDLGDIRDTSPPLSGRQDDDDGQNHGVDFSARSMVALGEVSLDPVLDAPNPDRWIPTHILPATHPLALTLRRDVTPQAIQPDGLVGTDVLTDTETVLDYTDPNPSVRVKCLRPHAGSCESLPECRTDGQQACCYGLPLSLLADYIVVVGDDTCCGALSAAELEEVQMLGHCQGQVPP